MRGLLLSLAVASVLGAALAFSGTGDTKPASEFVFELQDRNPTSSLTWRDGKEEFQFAIVSDRTGNHRANVFAQAVEKLRLLQPEFVVAVGDLIEGTKKQNELVAQWKEFDGYLTRLDMPFFYLAGNHDVGSKEATKFWQEKLGRLYYHFFYRDVLFLMLNADDPPGGGGSISKDQIAYVGKAIEQNMKARWTLVFVHRPLWTGDVKKNGWGEIEKALDGRPYTVFCGHVHRYQKFVRNGQFFYQLATTGGGSKLRGTEQGEFDHIAWVTMKKEGPLLANILLDSIHAEDLKKVETNEPGKTFNKKNLVAVRGALFFQGVPAPGAAVTLVSIKGGVKAEGIVGADGSFLLTTYSANDGVVPGEYTATVQWRVKDAQGKLGPNQLPARYADAKTSGLRVTIDRMETKELLLELTK